ncbi:TlpA family protein disulfide reductase [Actinoplanes sp. G11-F43]|uniref:TlpA family protein disulfide reductase n=1 Tax=Actinoplanes sp. G11-F43 TaxID=3424130 RepID=UPI003D32EBEB
MIRRLAASVAVLLMLSGCTAAAKPDEPDVPSPFAACHALPGKTEIPEMPDVSLRCFTGGGTVSLRTLSVPTVINIWGSWCGPCREELPIFQGLADRADGQFTVLSVNTKDTRNRGADFGTDASVSFPTLFDPEMTFATKIGATMLPATVFINADRKMYVHRAAMDVDELIEQVRKHIGVTVTR